MTTAPGTADIWLSWSPDLEHWGDHRRLLRPASAGAGTRLKIGLGPPPLPTADGWLSSTTACAATAARRDLPRRARAPRPRATRAGCSRGRRLGVRPGGRLRAGRATSATSSSLAAGCCRRRRHAARLLRRRRHERLRGDGEPLGPARVPRACDTARRAGLSRGSRRPRRRSPSSGGPTSGSRGGAGRTPPPR